MGQRPWSKFFWNDWRGDPAIRLCSLAARGLWMEMLCIAAEADPVGYVTVGSTTLDVPALARLTGEPADVIGPLLAELRQHGVFSVTQGGRIYNRRMVRDDKRRKDGALAAEFGESPTSRRGRKAADKHDEKRPPPIPPFTHMPEARFQKEKSAIADLSENGSRRLPDVAEAMTKIWNEECGSISRANKPNAARRANCVRRWREDFGADAVVWTAYCRRIAASPHLRGENDRGWHADLDWVLKPENMAHVLEGRYDSRSTKPHGERPFTIGVG